jgi:hypothetical protein
MYVSHLSGFLPLLSAIFCCLGVNTPETTKTISLPTMNNIQHQLTSPTATTVTITFTPPSGLDPGRLPWYSGYVTINSTASTSPPFLRIPYAGILGSLHSAPGLYSANSTNFPGTTYLGIWSMSPIEEAPPNPTFTVPRPLDTPTPGEPPRNTPYPVAVVTRKLASKLERIDVVAVEVKGELNTTVVLGVEIAGSMPGYPRRWTTLGGEEEPFTGRLADGRVVPEGRYKFLARTVKVFGDETKEGEGEWNLEWLPEFELRYGNTSSSR